MTAIATSDIARPQASARGNAVTGTWKLVRFLARRDRIKLPAWVLGISVFVLYYGAALPQLYQTQEDMQAITQLIHGPVGAIISGPGLGLDDPTIERILVGVYGLYFMIAAALMNVLLVSRHTRVVEQTGRAELIRASAVGRHAQLTAVLIVSVVANILLSLFIAGGMAASNLDTTDALLFGASVGAVGLVWAGITAVTAQVTEYSRAASGLSAAALGVAYVVRAAGDSLEPGGSLLSWFSPLAWAQQARPYVDGRWWPLGLSVVFAVIAAAVAYALADRRDLGAGLVAARQGRPEAAPWLRTPLAYAFRIHRAGLVGWGVGLVLSAVLYGAITQPIVDAVGDLPDLMTDVLGGDPSRLLDGYMGTMALTYALVVVVPVILGIHAARTEETRGRAEPVLATATSRWAWLGSHLIVLAVGAAVLLVASGLALGIATALSVVDAAWIWDTTAAALSYLPAVLVVLGLAALLFGLLPGLIGLSWALFAFALLIGYFGSLMDLPSWVFDLSPFEHIARYPLEEITWLPIVLLTLVAAGLVVLGLYGFRRRDIDSK